MGKYLVKRILKGLLTVFISLSSTFLIVRCMPANPAEILVDPMLGPEAVEAMNNTYLKANRQEDGVKSYGRMMDLLISLFEKENKLKPSKTA